MANTSAPFGFSQRTGVGSAPTYEQVESFCAYNCAAMYYGDPVFRSSDGSVYPTTPGTAALAGVFVGCEYLSTAMKRMVWSNYWPGTDVASTAPNPKVYLINDPNARFIAQVGGSTSTGLAATDIGANVQFAYGTPTAASGLSGAYIDISVTPTTTATLPFRVVSLANSPSPSNTGATGDPPTGAYNWAIVAFNNVETKTLTGI